MTDLATQVLHIFWFAILFTGAVIMGVTGVASLLVPVRRAGDTFVAYLVASLLFFLTAIAIVVVVLLMVQIVQGAL